MIWILVSLYKENIKLTNDKTKRKIMKNHIIENYFYDQPYDKIIVECGAFTGGEEICIDLENNYRWKYYGIEPSPSNFSFLTKRHPNGINDNIAISNSNGYTTFSEIVTSSGDSTGLSSLTHHPDIQKNILDINNARYKSIKYNVKTMTWDTYVEQKKLDKIDFLIVDTEGHETEIYGAMTKNSILPDVICTEFALSDRKNSITTENNFYGILKINDFLKKLGYRFNYVNYNNAMFSKESFWYQKSIPKSWHGENDIFYFWDVLYYDKSKLKDLLS